MRIRIDNKQEYQLIIALSSFVANELLKRKKKLIRKVLKINLRKLEMSSNNISINYSPGKGASSLMARNEVENNYDDIEARFMKSEMSSNSKCYYRREIIFSIKDIAVSQLSSDDKTLQPNRTKKTILSRYFVQRLMLQCGKCDQKLAKQATYRATLSKDLCYNSTSQVLAYRSSLLRLLLREIGGIQGGGFVLLLKVYDQEIERIKKATSRDKTT
ncbi:hypothetical protein GLOIN_2v1727591 [Rhizophagus clarus]|uniref:Uncharacterized protein n=1 Tax=Rhizophagus clarus TaxID=94130 RepID=A0A8H3L6A5_9GLOM|nr:hypothetical protein GLOIN_2v1727591 [Rhizophagus clarus]